MSGLRKLILGVPAVVLVIVVGLMALPFCGTCGGHDEAVTAVLKKCKRATELLGEDAHPARMGVACGSTETSGDRGNAQWRLPYTGEHGRGTVSFHAVKARDEWRVEDAVLEIDGETIDLVACSGGASPPRGRLAQTNADGVTGNFSGKVIRSDHATVAIGHECTGTLARERGSATATIKVTCRTNASEAEGQPLYEGRGAFTLDVRDAARADDDRVEFDDSTSSPSCRLSAADGKGTLTVWSKQPAWEIVIEL